MNQEKNLNFSMKIQARIVLLLAVLIVFFTNIMYGVLRWRIQSYHHDIERRYISRVLDSFLSTLQEREEELSAACRSMAESMPLRLILRDADAGSLPRRLHALLSESTVPIWAVVDTGGGELYRWSEDEREVDPAALRAMVRAATVAGVKVSGILGTDRGVLLTACEPVAEDGIRLATVIAGRIVSENAICSPHGAASLISITGRSNDEITAILDKIAQSSAPYIDYGGKETITAYTTLYDVFNQPVCVVKVQSTKVFLVEEKQTLLLALLGNTAIGLCVAFIVLMLLQKYVISRINILVAQVSSIRKGGDFSSRLQISGRDEVGELAAAFNEALGRLEEMARRIEESEARYATLVEQSRDGVLILVNDKIEYMNQRLATILGDRTDGETLNFFEPAERKKIEREISRDLSADKARTLQSRLIGGNGRELEIEIDMVQALFQGEPATFMYIRDVTEAKRMARHLQRVDKLTSLGQLSSGIAHEIRTPLASIQLNVDNLLQHDSLSQEQARLLENSREGIRRISDIVQHTLDFARPTKPRWENVRIDAIVDEVLAFVNANLRKADVSLEKIIDGEIPELQADGKQLNQAFLNIILNALQAMPGGGTLKVWVKSLRIGEKSMVEVGFEDTGFGIAPECQKRVFDPFYTTKFKGVGLGLSIVHRIVEAHQGTIDLQSSPGRGTTFLLRFPMKTKGEGER